MLFAPSALFLQSFPEILNRFLRDETFPSYQLPIYWICSETDMYRSNAIGEVSVNKDVSCNGSKLADEALFTLYRSCFKIWFLAKKKLS